jgi:hypothetical protein
MIKNYLAAGYPCLYFQTHEQDRTIGKILAGNWSTNSIVQSWECRFQVNRSCSDFSKTS